MRYTVDYPLTENPIVVGAHGSIFVGGPANFKQLRNQIVDLLLDQPVIHTNRWQQLDISESAAHGTHELLNVTIWYDMPETIESAQEMIKPDLPWAEAHFRERVGGEPINPGVQHANWPYHAQGADLHLKEIGDASNRRMGYDHNYMERMWCGTLDYEIEPMFWGESFTGYRFEVGDLGDVVEQLRQDPTTRQAYLPIWFPEDTGAKAGQRVPCSLGYHFIVRDDKLHVGYWLRSCEIYRHFTNDLYMAVRLAQWMRTKIEDEIAITMGQLTMNVVSLHAFVGDVEEIRRKL